MRDVFDQILLCPEAKKKKKKTTDVYISTKGETTGLTELSLMFALGQEQGREITDGLQRLTI